MEKCRLVGLSSTDFDLVQNLKRVHSSISKKTKIPLKPGHFQAEKIS